LISRFWRVSAATLFASSAMHVPALAQPTNTPISAPVVPKPRFAQRVDPLIAGPARGDAPLALTAKVRIVVPGGSTRLREIAALLAADVRRLTGIVLPVVHASCSDRDVICLDTVTAARPDGDTVGDDELHEVIATHDRVVLTAPRSEALLWSVRSFVQLLRPDEQSRGAWIVPNAFIHDRPWHAWRGSMIDVGRHFIPVRDIERHIDLLSRYKMNVLHWHLTDDQGWRLEIKRYPKLTSVGAWRTEADGSRSGGFYTQEQVRHLVEYARLRGVTIVPEIEMPGHSSAALASYPELACGNAPRSVPTSWGVFADIYCAGKPQVFTFLYGVLDEVMALFPSRFIHLGGDEVPKDRWKACAECQALMKREGLANEEALQSWFMQQVAKHVAAKGRTVIGWDEVLDGPFVPNGVVQSWRDSSFTRVAVQRGFGVIASPSDFTYINRSAAELRAVDVLNFQARPRFLKRSDALKVFGGEVTLWSEHIVSGANLELMALPRLIAFAEAMWSGGPRDYAEFAPRLASQEAALRADGYAVGPRDEALASIAVRYDSATQRPVLRARTFSDGLVVRATFDGTPPRATSPIVADGAVLSASNVIRLQPFWGADRVLEERRATMRRHDAIGARVRTEPEVDARYPGTGPFGLVDGLSGSDLHGDGLWQGWWKPKVTITVELPHAMSVSRVRVNFLQNVRSWIVLPRTVAMSFSTDGATWTVPITSTHAIPVSREGAIRQPFSATPSTKGPVKFVRITAESAGPLPPGHPGAGNVAWLFADEVEITSSATTTTR
jgi:hexosaminidase